LYLTDINLGLKRINDFRQKSDCRYETFRRLSPVPPNNPALDIGSCHRGDQMSLLKIAQNVAQTIFCPNQSITFSAEKMLLQNCSTFEIFKINNNPIGENSPNLVTLVVILSPY
jgi:hypothetical protein